MVCVIQKLLARRRLRTTPAASVATAVLVVAVEATENLEMVVKVELVPVEVGLAWEGIADGVPYSPRNLWKPLPIGRSC